MVFNKEASTETKKVILVNAHGLSNIASFGATLVFPANTVTKAEIDSTNMTVVQPGQGNLATGSVIIGGFSTTPTTEKTIATVTLTVAEGTGAFAVSISSAELYDKDENEPSSYDSCTVIIPAKDGSTIVETVTEKPSGDNSSSSSSGSSSADNSAATAKPNPTATAAPTATPSPTATPAPTKAPATAAPQTVTRPAQMNKPAVTEDPNKEIESADDENPEETPAPTAAPEQAPEFTGEGGEIKLAEFADISLWAPTVGTMVKQEWVSLKVSGTYGTDYVAKYKGVNLNKADFSDMINGYDSDVGVIDVIAYMSIQGKFGTTIELAPIYAEGTTYYIVDMKSSAEIGVHKITLDPNGGECSETTVKTSENKLKTLPTAKKEGYVLAGWTENGEDIILTSTEFLKDTTLTAIWETAPEPTASPKPADFKDLDSVPWASAQINALANLGIVNGKSEMSFDPNASVTRAEYTKMVCAALKVEPDDTLELSFDDVDEEHWAFGYIARAAKEGIVKGVSDKEFAPGRTITRQEMATILYRAINAKKKMMPSGTAKIFKDEEKIAEYAKIPVEKLSAAGVINGVSQDEFSPESTATRAQAACIIYQYYQAVGVASILGQ